MLVHLCRNHKVSDIVFPKLMFVHSHSVTECNYIPVILLEHHVFDLVLHRAKH